MYLPYYKMNRHIIIYLTIFVSACGQNEATVENIESDNKEFVNESLQSFSITEVTSDEFEIAKSKSNDKTLYDTINFKKEDGEIKLPVDRNPKPFVIFKDTLSETDETDIREYQYFGQFDNIGFYIVAGRFWEHFEFYLVDKQTGRQTTIWNAPTISPNDKFIANLSMDYGLEGVPNGIQVWSIERNKENQVEPISIYKHLEIDQLIWIPEELVWVTDNSFILKVVSVENFMESGGQPKVDDFYYLKMKI